MKVVVMADNRESIVVEIRDHDDNQINAKAAVEIAYGVGKPKGLHVEMEGQLYKWSRGKFEIVNPYN